MGKTSRRVYATYFERGGIHDLTMYQRSKHLMNPSTSLVADLGYIGVGKLHRESYLPHRKQCRPGLTSEQRKLSPEQRCVNRALAQIRILVEQVIRRAKVFRILSGRYRNRRRRLALRTNLIMAIYNIEYAKQLLKEV